MKRRLRLSHFLLAVAALYLIFISLEFPRFLDDSLYAGMEDERARIEGEDDLDKSFFSAVYKDAFHRKLEDNQNEDVPTMPRKEPLQVEKSLQEEREPIRPLQHRYGRISGKILRQRNETSEFSVLERMADEAWTLGLKAWEDMDNFDLKESVDNPIIEGKAEACPWWLSMNGDDFRRADRLVFLPCGLAAGSSITVVGTPHYAHREFVPQLAKLRKGDAMVMVSQFMVELQGLKSVDGEDPPKILHVNPRLKGDWSRRPVIEHNTCYRMQWGSAQRCDGLPSKKDDDILGKIYLHFHIKALAFIFVL